MTIYPSVNDIAQSEFLKPKVIEANRVLVFETEDEYVAYMMSLNNAFSKDVLISDINALHDNLFNGLLSEMNYTGLAELGLWAQSGDSEYYDEANALLAWYTTTCSLIEQYSSTITEENATTPEAFIQTLPAFTFGE